MAEYLLAVWGREGRPGPKTKSVEQTYADVEAFNHKLRTSGNWVFAGGLHPVEASSVVDATGETVAITDGPFAESKEQIGGFWVIRAEHLDEALALAQEASAACDGPIEVRPFEDE